MQINYSFQDLNHGAEPLYRYRLDVSNLSLILLCSFIMLQGRGELKTTTTKKQILVITNFTKSTVNGGHIGRLNVHARNYFAFFYSFELKLCRMVELCISKKLTFFFLFFDFSFFGEKMASQDWQQK